MCIISQGRVIFRPSGSVLSASLSASGFFSSRDPAFRTIGLLVWQERGRDTVYGSEWQARTSAELSARRGANRPRVRQGWVTCSSLPYPSPPARPPIGPRPRRSGGPATTDPRRAHANCAGCNAWRSVAGPSLDGRSECYRRSQVLGGMGH